MKNRMFAILALLLVTAFAVSGVITKSQAQGTAATPAATSVGNTLYNLNTGTSDQYLTIPNMNGRMVREFMEYRPYESILVFRKEIGKYVDASQVAEWEKYVFVPIQIDQADVATLKQIPGVTDQIANDLISARPYNTNDAFLTKLATYLSADQVSYAKNLLEAK